MKTRLPAARKPEGVLPPQTAVDGLFEGRPWMFLGLLWAGRLRMSKGRMKPEKAWKEHMRHVLIFVILLSMVLGFYTIFF
jgi:hypothetical protein